MKKIETIVIHYYKMNPIESKDLVVGEEYLINYGPCYFGHYIGTFQFSEGKIDSFGFLRFYYNGQIFSVEPRLFLDSVYFKVPSIQFDENGQRIH